MFSGSGTGAPMITTAGRRRAAKALLAVSALQALMITPLRGQRRFMPDPKPILIVDDNVDDREMIAAAFEQCRLPNTLVTVRNGAAALDWLYRRGAYVRRPPYDPAVVLLDVTLAHAGSLDLLRTMRADPRQRCVPVVALAAPEDDETIAEAYRCGANACVAKPVSLGEFFRAMQGVATFWAMFNRPPPSAW